MAMFLSGVSEIIIQRVGRWASFAFLEYIREQIDSFTIGVSEKMLKFESFHHLNEKEAESLDQKSEAATKSGKGDGPVEIPFRIHYSEAILNDTIEEDDIEDE